MKRKMLRFQTIRAILLIVLLASCSPQNAKVAVSKEELQEIQSFPEDVVFFTSVSNPIKSLEELQGGEDARWGGEVAMWGGMELKEPLQKLLALNSRTDPLVIGVWQPSYDISQFNKNPKLRLFVTYEAWAKEIIDGGGIRIEFVKKRE